MPMTYPNWDQIQDIPPPPPGYAGGFVAGPVTSMAFTVGANADGDFEVFAIGRDGAVWHKIQYGGQLWAAWGSLGAPPGIGLVANEVPPMLVAQNQDGRLELFVTDGGGDVWHIWQSDRNGPWLLVWVPLGQPTAQDLAGYGGYTKKLFLDTGGCLQVIVQAGPNNEIFSRGQTAANGGWGNWISLGAPPDNVVAYLVPPPGGSLFDQLLVQAGSNNLPPIMPFYESRKSNFVEGFANWSAWARSKITTPAAANGVYASIVAVNEDKRLELFAIGNYDSHIWHTWQDANFEWTQPWASLGAPPNNVADLRYPVIDVVQDELGCLTLAWFQPRADGFVYTISQTAKNVGWGTWQQGPACPLAGTDLRLMRRPNGLLTIFARTAANGLVCIPQAVV
jgi:hypothetical protein